jgi:glycosyltransferase involved in cell wall biosynthesis
MNITLIGPVYPYRGGIAHVNTLLARALKDHGHHTQMISFMKQYPNWLYPGRSDKDPSKRPLRIDAEFLLNPLRPWTWYQTTKRILKFHPDMVVIHWWTTFWAIPFAALSTSLRRKSISIVYLIHNVVPHEKKLWDPCLTRIALSTRDSFLVLSQNEKKRLLDLMPDAQVKVSELPVFSMFSENRMPKSQARKQLGLSENIPIMLFFGIVRPYKGLKYLLEAQALLLEQGIETYLVIAGEFWEDCGVYREQIDKLNLSDLVKIDNRYIPNEEVAVMLSAADLMVVPYIGGTQSGAAKVALGFGLPLIITDIVAQGIPERNKEKILIVPAADSNALASAIQNFIQSPIPEEPIYNSADNDWYNLVADLENLFGK